MAYLSTKFEDFLATSEMKEDPKRKIGRG